MLVELVDDPAQEKQSVNFFAFSNTPSQSAEDTGKLYRVVEAATIPYSEYRSLGYAIPQNVQEFWAFKVAMGDSESWLDTGINTWIDVYKAIDDVAQTEGKVYLIME